MDLHTKEIRNFYSSFETYALLVFSVLLSLLLVGCSTYSVQRDFDRDYQFSKAETFFVVPHDREKRDNDSLLQTTTKTLLRTELKEKGLAEARTQEAADLVAHFTISMDRELTVDYLSGIYGYSTLSYYPASYPASYSSQRRIAVPDKFTEGTLLVEMIDREKNQSIWRGIAEGVIEDDWVLEGERDDIEEAVSQVLEDFPPETSTVE